MTFRKWIAAAASAAWLGSAGVASADVIATFDIFGTFDIGPTTDGTTTLTNFDGDTFDVTTTDTGTAVDIDGGFEGEVLAPIPVGPTDFILSASLSLGPVGSPILVEVFGGSLPATFDPALVLPDLGFIAALIAGGAGSPIEFGIGGGDATLLYDGAISVLTATEIVGTFGIDLITTVALAPEVDSLLAFLDPAGDFIPSGFSFPSDEAGDFLIELSVATVPAVPLPAGGLLLISGVAAFGWIRRRKAA